MSLREANSILKEHAQFDALTTTRDPATQAARALWLAKKSGSDSADASIAAITEIERIAGSLDPEKHARLIEAARTTKASLEETMVASPRFAVPGDSLSHLPIIRPTRNPLSDPSKKKPSPRASSPRGKAPTAQLPEITADPMTKPTQTKKRSSSRPPTRASSRKGT